MDVIIVGGGIGGLTSALQLHRHGVERVVVYEQSAQIRELGVGLNLLPHAVAELSRLGLGAQLEQVGIATGELTYATYRGQVIHREPRGREAGERFPQVSVHRGRLQALLLRAVRDRLGPDAVRTGHRLVNLTQDDARGVTAFFNDPAGRALRPVRGEVLVGADGIHSRVRSLRHPSEGPPVGNGVTMWRGATDWPAQWGSEAMRGRSMLVAGGRKVMFVGYALGAGQRPGTVLINWALCVRTSGPDAVRERQDWADLAAFADFERYLGRFEIPGFALYGLLKTTKVVYRYPMWDRDPLAAWTVGRVTLLGDAAHPMLSLIHI